MPQANEPGAAAGASCHLRPTKVAENHMLFSFLPCHISSNRAEINLRGGNYYAMHDVDDS